MKHNHITRDIKKKGICPGCDKTRESDVKDFNKLEPMTVNEDGTLSIPAETYDVIAEAAKKKYNFRGTSARTVKKYVTKFIEESLTEYIAEHTVEVPDFALPKKKEKKDA